MPTIILTGGGTGGHLRIVEALKSQLAKDPNVRLVYVGSTKGQDEVWFGADGDFAHTYFLPTRGFGRGLWAKLQAGLRLLYAWGKALYLVVRFRPKVVFSVGGFSAAPMTLVAILCRVRLYVHEQNSILGRLNALCVPFAKAIYCAFEVPRTTPMPYPVVSDFFEAYRPRQSLRCVLFLGGSAGAKFLNALALQMAPVLHERGIVILHQTGQQEFDHIKNAYEDMGIGAEVFAFSQDMPSLMAKADVAIARAGASSVWEFAACGLPSVLVPYPFATHDHQYHNAQYFARQGVAKVLRQEDASCKNAFEALEDLDLEQASKVLHGLGDQNAVHRLIVAMQKSH